MREILNAPYASNFNQSRGRLFGTSKSPTRSEFQRDRDRIIHSTAFRRLQHKTQVFLHHEGQHFRTRLTHTLEVSQIARSISRALKLDEDLAEAIALAHDLGHTPFGHAGERALDVYLTKFGGFDHNVQALRTITILENRYAEHDGLNLSWEALDGIFKHNGPVDEKALKLLNFLPEGLQFPNHGFSCLEAQSAAIADDIAYNAHDLDDAVRAGLLDLQALRDAPLIGPIVCDVLTRFPDIEIQRQAHEIQRRLITQMIEKVIAHALRKIDELDIQSVEQVRALDQPLICFPDELKESEQEFKKFMFANVYRAEMVMHSVEKGEMIVGALFDAFMGGTLLPAKWQDRVHNSQNECEGARHISDYIAGMTDPFAISEYERLFDVQVDFS